MTFEAFEGGMCLRNNLDIFEAGIQCKRKHDRGDKADADERNIGGKTLNLMEALVKNSDFI